MSKSFFPAAPQPISGLARYRLLSPRAGIHVSPIQLGAMNIGDKWHQYGMGSMDKESSMKLLDAYYDNGGNFIDTANAYQDGTSEGFIGEWMENRGNRARMIIATKYTVNTNFHDDDTQHIFHFQGNNSKSLRTSIERSLKNLRTDYIDIFYVHWWDFSTSIEELMNSLHHLVQSGKVLYLGISDSHLLHGWSACATSTRVTMARLSMALAPWNVLAAGRFRTDEVRGVVRPASMEERHSEIGSVVTTRSGSLLALQEVAKGIGAAHITSVAIAYVMQKAPFVFPIIGGRKIEHLLANLEALEITLTPEHIKRLESVVPFTPGFPNNMIGDGSSYPHMFKTVVNVEDIPRLEAIRPNRQ